MDATVELARKLVIPTTVCTTATADMEATRKPAIELHPDYRYSPKLVTAMGSMIASGEFDVVPGSRVLGRGALVVGMPVYQYISNRFLTLFENTMIGENLSEAEYHTGFRAWSRGAWKINIAK